MTAWTFDLRAARGNTFLGLAVVAPEARYVAVLPVGNHPVDHKAIPAADWEGLEAELDAPLTSETWPDDSAVVRALALTGLGTTVRYFSTRQVHVPALGATEALDKFLSRQIRPTRH